MNKKNKIFLFLIIIIGGLLRFIDLGRRPFDGDEGIIVLIANNSWHDLLVKASLDVHPPLYHLLLKLFIYFGVSEFSVRLLSAIAGVIFIYLIYIFTQKILVQSTKKSETIALIAAGLAAISPFLIYPSQEARMYALFALLSLASYYCFYQLISQKPTTKFILAYILFSVAVCYTQYLGFIVVGGQFLYLLLLRRDIIKQYKIWLLSYISMLLLFLPQLPTAYAQFAARTSEQTQTGSYLENIKGVFGAFYRFGAGRLFLDVNPENIKNLLMSHQIGFLLFVTSLFIPFVIFIFGVVYFYKKNKQICLFLLFPMIIGIILAIFSTEIGSRASRYFIYLYPMYLIFLSYGVASFWSGWKKILPILLIIIFIAGLCVHYIKDLKSPGVNTIAQFINSNVKENQAVLIRGGFGGGEKWVLQYYLQKNPIANIYIPIVDMFEDYTPGNLATLKEIKPIEKINQMLAQYDKVYFYDMTYATNNLSNAKEYVLGYDKEGKPLTVWQISK